VHPVGSYCTELTKLMQCGSVVMLKDYIRSHSAQGWLHCYSTSLDVGESSGHLVRSAEDCWCWFQQSSFIIRHCTGKLYMCCALTPLSSMSRKQMD